MLLESGGFNHCVRAREGYVVYNRNDIYIGRAIESYGEYAEIEAQLLRQLCPVGGSVIEVGANIGTHTLVLAKAVGTSGSVIAFEPQRVVFQTLCANLALNSLTQVDARHAAVGTSTGWVGIPEIDYSLIANYGGLEIGTFAAGTPVRLARLDEEFTGARLDLVKVDVEGMEREVLLGAQGLLSRFRPLLYVENDRIDRSEALIGMLLAQEYRLYWHLPPLFNPDNFFANPANLYPGIVSVNMLAIPRERTQNVTGLSEIRDPSEHPFKRADAQSPQSRGDE